MRNVSLAAMIGAALLIQTSGASAGDVRLAQTSSSPAPADKAATDKPMPSKTIVRSVKMRGTVDAVDKDKGTVFEVYKDKSDEFRFRLVHGDEKLAIAPHGYKTKEDVMKAISTIQKEAAKAKARGVARFAQR